MNLRLVNRREIEAEFDDYLDSIYDSYQICGVTVTPPDLLKTDGPAYRDALNDWLDTQLLNKVYIEKDNKIYSSY